MAETSAKASPKKVATKPVAKPAAAAKPVAAAKPAAAVKPVAVAKPAKPEASAKPVAAAAKPAAAKPAAVKKPAVAKSEKPAAKPAAKAAAKVIVLSDEQRYRMVAEAAYFRAERNQFKSDPLRDWIDAESDIGKLLSDNK